MAKLSDYEPRRDSAWQLWVLPEWWSEELQKTVMQRVGEQARSRHPQTIHLEFAGRDHAIQCFLKVFHSSGICDGIKNLFRRSKAKRFWRQGLALSAGGFNVPLAIATGELRRYRVLQRAFVLTMGVAGQPLPQALAGLVENLPDAGSIKRKRTGLLRLAELVQRFHRQGFVHGDLVAGNLLVVMNYDQEPEFYFMDNDRTRSFPFWLPQPLWKRNLVQLNRMPLPGVTLQDRMRFLCRYLGRHRLTKTDGEFARWLERKTRRRRYECDGVDPRANFRQIMAYPIATTTIDR